MSIVLYTAHGASPAARTVETIIRILKLDVKVNRLDLLKRENLAPWFLELNPTHQVPVINDNGYVLTDSHAITAYLLTSYAPKNILEQYYPTDPKQRGIIDSRWHFETGTLFERMKMIIGQVLLRGVREVPLENTKNLAEGVDFLEQLLEGKEWLAGDRLTVADISAVKTIDLIDFLIPLKHYKNVSAWAKRVREACPFYEDISRKQVYNFGTVLKNSGIYDIDDRWNKIQNIVS